MGTELKVFQDGDDALLVWNVDAAIEGCRGFAIQRKLTRDGTTATTWLENYVGFAGQPAKPGEHEPSTTWPLQEFSWTDHQIGSGDRARYRVVPMVRAADGTLAQQDQLASDWQPEATAAAAAPASPYRAYFNRGFVISQFMARYLKDTGKTLAQFKATIGEQDDHTIRRFLSGDLREAMLALLDEAQHGEGEIYAALFELADQELLDRLVALGPRAHVVLANGSIQKQQDETTAQARTRDENADGRRRLVGANVDVELDNRFLSPGALGHNKFLVLTDAHGAAQVAWTGSTNWTPTGLCTQLNNGLRIDDPAVAATYLEQWKALRAAQSAFPQALVDGNTQPKTAGDATVWFSRTHGKADLAALSEVVAGAQHAILFLMFMPGAKGVLGDVLKRVGEPGLVVRGVVSELPKGRGDESVADVTVVGHGQANTHRLDIVQPEGIPHAFANWAAEVTHSQFLHSIGFAIVHSKVLVIDPLSDAPTVVTGSHNFSESASAENDENFVIVRGDRALAETYLVNILGAYHHYRSRARHGKPYDGLQDSDHWMAPALAARKRDAALWGF